MLLLATPMAWAAEPAFEIRAVAEHPGPTAQEYLQAAAGDAPPKKVYLEPETLLGLDAVRSASAVYVDDDRWTVRLVLTGHGSDRLAEITAKYLGQRIAILLEGKLLNAATVRAVVRGSLDIAADSTADEAFRLAASLNAAITKAAASATPGSP